MKIKTSITLSEDLAKEIDQFLGQKENRSAFVEQVLRDYLADHRQQSLDAKSIAFLKQRVSQLNQETRDVLGYLEGLQISKKANYPLNMQHIERVVQEVVQSHFETEPEIDEIVWFNNGLEPEICLLEINRDALPAGSVLVFSFAPNEDVPFPVRIADVTPQEWERIKQGEIALPPGWSLKKAQIFHRPKE